MSQSSVTLRAAMTEDAEMVFRWRNDPFLVARASSQKYVSWEEHVCWFQETVMGSDRKMFIVLVDGVPAGQIRFHLAEDETWVISAYVLEAYTGRGLGVQAIQAGCELLFADCAATNVVAFVRDDNIPSQSAFRKAGFTDAWEPGGCPPNHRKLVLWRKEALPGKATVA